MISIFVIKLLMLIPLSKTPLIAASSYFVTTDLDPSGGNFVLNGRGSVSKACMVKSGLLKFQIMELSCEWQFLNLTKSGKNMSVVKTYSTEDKSSDGTVPSDKTSDSIL